MCVYVSPESIYMTMVLLLGVAAAHSPMENPMFWLPYIGVTICLGTVGFLLWRFMVRYDGVLSFLAILAFGIFTSVLCWQAIVIPAGKVGGVSPSRILKSYRWGPCRRLALAAGNRM